MAAREPARAYPLRVSGWGAIPGLVHGFLGRAHALPPGPFRAADLRQRLAAAGEKVDVVLAARQTHGARVLAPDDPERVAADWEESPWPAILADADALVSAAPVVLTIRTADCVPILLVAPAHHAVAAVHAGWKGMLAGVVERALAMLGARHGARPTEVLAAIGPAIGACCYEFGAEHAESLAATLGRAVLERAWRPRPRATASPSRGADDAAPTDRGHLDLRLVARIALESGGVPAAAITTIGPCTADHPEELHSYRRDGANAGRQLSYIGWRR